MAEGSRSLLDGAGCAEDDSSQLLANALKKMDGLIGDFRPASGDEGAPVSFSSDPTVMKIVDHCDKLHTLIVEWNAKSACPSDSMVTSPPPVTNPLHPRVCVPAQVQETIITWLGGVTSVNSQRLLQDKDELLEQMVSVQRELEASQTHSSKLAGKLEDVERVCMQKDQEVRDMAEQVRTAKVSLSTKEVELRHLKDQLQAGYRSDHEPKQVAFAGLPPHEPMIHRRSIRRSLRKAFGMKGHSSSKHQDSRATEPHPPTNPKAAAFCSQSSEQLCEWLSGIGLSMYSDLVMDKHVTGERLAEMVAEPTNQHLVQLGILSSLHCKKVRLAVEAALGENSMTELDVLDHVWVGQWVESLGLPQYKQVFLDARVDGRMLNVISMQDLRLLDVTTPFHVASIKRALEALRLCNYDKDYLLVKDEEKAHGSQKLLHWSAKAVSEWVCSIELEQHAPSLDKTGIHGPVMFLDVQFTSESLAKALGIGPAKTILRKHLSRKFMELIGPVAAQMKVDAMQNKTFVPLDPTEQASGHGRGRSRSVSNKRGPRKGSVEELLLPLEAYQASAAPTARCPSPV